MASFVLLIMAPSLVLEAFYQGSYNIWTVTLKADVQEEEIWKKLLGRAGGVGEMVFLNFFFPKCSLNSAQLRNELTEKNLFLFVPWENMSPVSIFLPLLRTASQQLFTWKIGTS